MAPIKNVFAAIACSAAIIGSTPALADPPRYHRWHGDIHRFHRYDFPRWRDGYWHHGHHHGRFGWWWVVADAWYFYPTPIYPYPDPYVPPVVVIEPDAAPPPPREPVWYYCKSSRNYYPYVSVCPEGWRTVPAEPSDADDDREEP